MKLAFIGNSNWDIFDKGDGQLVAIPKPGNNASSSHYGDRDHVKRLIDMGCFQDKPTDHGLELMSGIHTKIFSNGSTLISFL